MANGGTFGALVDEGRGKGAIVIIAATTLASGMAWWFSQDGRDAIDNLRTERNAQFDAARIERKEEIAALRTELKADIAALRTERAEMEAEIRALVAGALASNQATSDYRMEAITERFGRMDVALQNHIGRTEFDYFVRDVERTMNTLSSAVEWLRDRLIGHRSPRDSQGPR